MAKTSSIPAPLTFDLEESLVDRIEELREELGFRSTSEVVRLAISKYNFDRFKPEASKHRQISVRLTGDMRSMLKKQARTKNASIGELLRVAIEGLSEVGIKKADKDTKSKTKKKGR